MNKGTPSLMQEDNVFIQSEVSFVHAKKVVEKVGLEPRVEEQALRCGGGWCTVERRRSKKGGGQTLQDALAAQRNKEGLGPESGFGDLEVKLVVNRSTREIIRGWR